MLECGDFKTPGDEAVAYRGGVWCVQTPPPPPNSEGPSKSCQTQPNCENC